MRQKSSLYPRGLTKLELIVAVSVILVFLVVAFVVLKGSVANGGPAYLLRDGVQMKQIHEAWIVFARDGGGRMPTPGRFGGLTEDLQPILLDDANSSLNTTANVHSLCIMLNWYSPELCVSPVEPNANVMVCDDYDWEAWDPAAGVFWDPNFRADLDDVSHVSYASMPLFGRRYDEQWMESYDARFAMIGTRGPKHGIPDPDSITCEFFGPRSEWAGNVCFSDNHFDVLDTFAPRQAVYVDAAGVEQPDNIFRFDDGLAGGDAILTIITEMTPTGPIIQHD